MSTTSYIFVCSVGPVQSFIASARKTLDLWSGSYILSDLIRIALEESEQAGAKLIQPMSIPKRTKVASLPNRFLVQIDGQASDVVAFGQRIEETIRTYWSSQVLAGVELAFDEKTGHVKSQAIEQAEDALEIYWAYERLTDYPTTRIRLEQMLASTKLSKQFTTQVQTNLTCSVCHERDALSDRPTQPDDSYAELKENTHALWTRLKGNDGHMMVRESEHLCSICLLKRLYPRLHRSIGIESFESTRGFTEGQDGYFAIVMADGDDMGKWIGGRDTALSSHEPGTLQYHQELSRRLTQFAEVEVPDITEQFNDSEGRVQLIYAGGDDVLAFVSLAKVFPFLRMAHDRFGSEQGLHESATMSAGIAIVHSSMPLQHAIRVAREMEHQAKQLDGKDGVGIQIVSNSGQGRRFVVPFDQLERLDRIRESLMTDVSTTFMYHFFEAFRRFGPTDAEKPFLNTPALIRSEIKRLVLRASSGRASADRLEQLVDDLHNLYLLPDVRTLLEYFHLLEAQRFLAKRLNKEVVR